MTRVSQPVRLAALRNLIDRRFVAPLAATVMTAAAIAALVATADARTLSFDERVAAQRAIEQVYWNHRIWPR